MEEKTFIRVKLHTVPTQEEKNIGKDTIKETPTQLFTIIAKENTKNKESNSKWTSQELSIKTQH